MNFGKPPPRENSDLKFVREGEEVGLIWRWLLEADALGRHNDIAEVASLLSRNADRVWQLLREMPVGLVLYDDEFKVIFQNHASELMTGFSSAEIIGRSPLGAWMPMEQATVAKELLRRMRTERIALHGRTEHQRRDGKRSWVEWFTTPLFDGDRLLGYLGTHSDINDQLLAHEAAARAERRVAVLVDAAIDMALLELSPTGRVASWSPNAARMFGRPFNEVLGVDFAFMFEADSTGSAMPADLLARCVTETRVEYEGRIRRGSNESFWGCLVFYPLRGDDGTLLGVAVVARDTTEQWEAENALLEYRRQLSRLTHQLLDAEQQTNRRLAQMLHDQLGQTFTALRISTDALRKRLPETADRDVQSSWERITKLIDRGIGEVRDVLMDLRPPFLEEQGLSVALDNEVREAAAQHPAVAFRLVVGKLTAVRRWPPDVEYATFMVAREAIGNALAHSKGLRITVTLEGLGETGLRLAVSDDGMGLCKDSVPAPGHLGLIGMRERAEAIGAIFGATSGMSGGTRIEFVVPSK